MAKFSTRDFLIGGAVFSAVGACLVRRRYGLLVFLLLIAGAMLLAYFAFRLLVWSVRKARQYGAAAVQGANQGIEEARRDWKAAREAEGAMRRYFLGADGCYRLTEEIVVLNDGTPCVRVKEATEEDFREGMFHSAWNPVKNPPVRTLVHEGTEHALEEQACEVEGYEGRFIPLRPVKARRRRRRRRRESCMPI